MRIITFFNSKGGVGKTTTLYHIAWMLSELGIKTIAVDLDPQSNLTSMCLADEKLESIYEGNKPVTILDALTPIVNGDPAPPVHIEPINDYLGLILGNPALSTFEDTLSNAWLKCLNRDAYAFKITSIFSTIIHQAAQRSNAEVVLVDVGPNLGAINRAVTISSDYLITPVTSDVFSLLEIKSVGHTLRLWKEQWQQRKALKPENLTIDIPEHTVTPAGYVIMQYSAKEGQPTQSYLKWANRIPNVYNEFVLGNANSHVSVNNDTHCIGLLKHFRSLAPMSMEVHKPIFLLKPADGAIGAHLYAVQKAYDEFKALTESILKKCP